MKTKLSIMLLLFCQIVFSQYLEKTASDFVNNLFTKKYAESIKLEDDEVKDKMTESVLEMVNGQLSGMFGDYKKVISTEKTVEDGIPMILVYTEFSKQNVNFKVPFSKNNKVLGIFKGPDKKETSKVNRPQTPKPPYSYNTEEVTITNPIDKNLLAGTLTTPQNYNKNIPIYVLITGSGQQDRDSEFYDHKPFAVIANYLGNNNIATLRMDDRGVGQSSPGKSTDTTENYATDIMAAVNFLVQKGFSNIGLIGHSEGGAIAPMVVAKNKNIKNIILLAGPGLPGNELLTLQNKRIDEVYGATPEQIEDDIKVKSFFFKFVREYKGHNFSKDAHEELKKFFARNTTKIPAKAQVQLSEILINSMVPWMISFLKSTPEQYLIQVKIPVLALNGGLDLQITPEENLKAIKNALTKAGNKDFEVLEIPGLNHLFQTAKTGSPKEYEEIEETFSPKALEIMKNWIQKHQK
ncbi:alpha/beta fold hydrolase [Elizabethkingia bruuniana]|uniref:Alpha/beta fold hydrolase n=1 Tax=Elizabethkingia bruuniana TaxID=1756149 RepID=A0A7T7UVX0_9FLAO|nr:alpha/beta fold hydrolase [Elizabethkingia bruuniana]KGO10859.1 alpha/beta hydrolase [Elizabethkingia miricola]AQX83665.1 alpha/beta hydrolase [Elizabethkingia bruuniana]KUY22220.1 alpha/beta hydrolase [Elizabethkingia bruuniana]OPB62431.1 alpha/beta hydrolase [Elizabethkingia bruuniana]QQN57066.1 alpha/beta fold hydrolase [Elizabethkingia bruuniana]